MKAKETDKVKKQSEKVDDLELRAEQADVIQAGTENAESGEIKARFRYTGSAGSC